MTSRTRILIPAAVTTLTLGLAGCGITDPYTTTHHANPTATPAPTAISTNTSATSTVDDPSDPMGGIHPPGQLTTGPTGPTTTPTVAATTPQAALTAYARLDTNWTAQTIGTIQDRLAAISNGQARAAALQAAASYRRDTVLQHSHVRNTGTIVAIAPSQTTAGVWVVVTREHTAGQGDYAGLPAQLHVTYARVIHAPSGYQVSQWSAVA